MDYAEHRNRNKLTTNLLTVGILIVVLHLVACLRFAAISHNCTFNTTNYVAHEMLVHTNSSGLTLWMLQN